MQSTRNIQSYPDTIDRGRRSCVGIPLAIALLSAGFAGMSPLPAAAQDAAATPQTSAASPDAIKQREQELEATRAQQKGAAELQQKLKAEIAAIGQDRSKLNAQLIDIAGQVRGVETRIGDAEARLRPLDSREQQIRGSLDSRRSEIVEVLAALQRAGRRTPPALLVRPEDALQSLRTAMLLGAVVPELRARAEKLVGDLTELVTLRKTIATERDQLAVDRDKLRDDQTRLAALVEERQRKQSGRQPAGPDRQNGAGFAERRESGRNRQPAGRPAHPQRQAESGGAEGPRPDEPGHCFCVRQGTICDAG